ncbi:MAG: hypothetical protein GY913_33450 [Proteobacteria bacterium]|nr:hypothetical protein [Pseudomonadota bacterium]MCP4921833.1 hypothetical protein [Pseudomonadota bacterium]
MPGLILTAPVAQAGDVPWYGPGEDPDMPWPTDGVQAMADLARDLPAGPDLARARLEMIAGEHQAALDRLTPLLVDHEAGEQAWMLAADLAAHEGRCDVVETAWDAMVVESRDVAGFIALRGWECSAEPIWRERGAAVCRGICTPVSAAAWARSRSRRRWIRPSTSRS